MLTSQFSTQTETTNMADGPLDGELRKGMESAALPIERDAMNRPIILDGCHTLHFHDVFAVILRQTVALLCAWEWASSWLGTPGRAVSDLAGGGSLEHGDFRAPAQFSES
jgi:hypothetical protein